MPASAAATAAANHTFGLLLTELHKKIKHLKSVKDACNNLQRDLKIFAAYMDDEIKRDACTNMDRARSEVVRELVFDVEDCIERYMYRITCLDDAKWLPWIGGTVKTLLVRNRFAKQIKKLNDRVRQAGVQQINIGSITAPAGGVDQRNRVIDQDPVGFDHAKKEVLALLDEVENEPGGKLRVIAIVGFGGSGKTTLVSGVYESFRPADDDAEATQFPLRAWVDRRHYQNEACLLKRIILEFWPVEGKTAVKSSDPGNLRRYIQNNTKNKRYLIILDDMKMNLWGAIDLTFKDEGISSRIIVTTSFLPSAKLCSSYSRKRSRGYVYKMRSLCNEDSQTLAHLKEIVHDSCPCHQQRQCPLQTLQKKCDGLPLALVSSAYHLESIQTSDPTIDDCETLCNDLGSLLQQNTDNVAATARAQLDTFADLRGVLKNNYASLADGTLGACCLLYLGISPDARCLKKNKITRRWVAEGYAPSEQEQAEEIFNKLIDLNIIQPVGIRNSPKSKVHGIVYEFVLHKAMMEKFVKTIDLAEKSRDSTGGKKQKSRHLFVRGGNTTSSRAATSMDLSHVRSLTVVTATNESNNVRSGCAGQEDVEGNNVPSSAGQDNVEDHGSGSACDGFFEFSKYRLLRVLDLEECTEVNNSHLANICDLWNLRYLSLGPKVNKLPNEIKLLKLLGRLQLSKTKVTELPAEIIGMPCLKHLIGRFVLLGPEPSAELVENNKLETLSGIVVDQRHGFLRLVPRLKNLMKVNMCFDQSSRNILDLKDPLLDAIKGYLQRDDLGRGFSRSLSIDFQSLYRTNYESYRQYAMEQLLHGMTRPSDPQMKQNPQYYYLTSLKLHDKLLSPWPQFVALLSGLTKLSLSLKSVTQDLLSAISNLQHFLKHLKLMADGIPQDLVIQNGTFFTSLETLCFVVREPNGIPKIQIEGNMPALRYLQLISKVLAPELCGIQIRNLTRLQEIELHAEVSPEARQEWETAAMTDHPNRPDVLPLRSVRGPTREEARAVPATTSGNTLDQEPAVHPVAVEVETPAESPIITDTETSHEPTLIPFAYSSTPGNHHDPQYLADSVASAATEDAVASPKLVVVKRLGVTTVQNTSFANNHGPDAERDKPSEKPIAVDEEAPDTSNSPTTQPVDEASNHAPVNNASNGVHGVDANGHVQDH